MSYTFTKTEQNNLKASVFETKSLLYLASQCTKYKRINVLTVDCFNDVSGMCEEENIWDIQAKNEQSLTPRKIGTYLITLYENYISEFKPFFQEFIFFMPELKSDYVESSSLPSYGIKNFKDTHRKKLIEGLKVKANLDESINLDLFFEKVLFVEDRSEEKMYVKGLMHFKASKFINEQFFKAIFTEIRDRQTALKNSEIENIRIERPNDVLKFERSFTTEQLQVFVLNRFIGADVFSNQRRCPSSYIRFTRKFSDDDAEDHIYDQNAALSRAFFDKSNQRNFWLLFDAIFKNFCKDKNATVSDVTKNINSNLIDKVEHMNIESTRFLIAMVKDGLIYEN